MLPTSLLITAFGQLQGKTDAVSPANVDVLLQRLVEIDPDTSPDFAAELQAIFTQLPAPVLQELKLLVERGNDLPQAATGLLEARSDGQGRHPFANLMQPSARGAAATTVEADGMPEAGAARRDAGAPALATATHVMPTATPPDPASRPSPVPPGLAEPVGDEVSGLLGGLPRTTVQAGGGTLMSPALASSLLQMGVPEPVGGRAWPAAVADRVLWMVQGEQQVARLKLNPPNLGPLEVRLTLQHDQASVVFSAQHLAVRDALEAALPRLRELLEQQSLQLVQADVNDPGGQREDKAGTANPHRPGGANPLDEDGEIPSLPVTAARQVNGLVDLFA